MDYEQAENALRNGELIGASGYDEASGVLKAFASLRAENERLREALEAIAEPDALLDANKDAFNAHADRRMHEIARAALRREEGERPNFIRCDGCRTGKGPCDPPCKPSVRREEE